MFTSWKFTIMKLDMATFTMLGFDDRCMQSRSCGISACLYPGVVYFEFPQNFILGLCIQIYKPLCSCAGWWGPERGVSIADQDQRRTGQASIFHQSSLQCLYSGKCHSGMYCYSFGNSLGNLTKHVNDNCSRIEYVVVTKLKLFFCSM